MQLHRIFVSISGEQNAFGIGYPSIFVRFYGCSQNCWEGKSGASMCDTPEGKEGNKCTEITPEQLFHQVKKAAEKYSIGFVTLTGGEPLEQDKDEMIEFLDLCAEESLVVSVETNGMESIEPFTEFSNINFVVDWKLHSAGLKANKISEEVGMLGEDDYVKFVVKDDFDFVAAVNIIKEIRQYDCKIAVGLHNQSEFSYQDLIDMLYMKKVLGDVTINFQAHKLLKLL